MTRPPNKMITAAIFGVADGRELRVSYSGEPNPLDCLALDSAAALESRANELRTVLEENGWRVIAAN
ncbi:MAG: hypothetical protein GEU82_18320 [Luteitalea sp.]|nr:hypothetical protein [Luteitalea sp.]